MATIFEITHDIGTDDEYDAKVGDPDGDLSVTKAAALAGTAYGLSCLVDDLVNKSYRKDFTAPPASGYIALRFHIDPNTLTMSAENEDILGVIGIGCEPNEPDTLWRIQLGMTLGGNYILECQPRHDGGKLAASTCQITDAPHWAEVHVQRATSDVASNGHVRWWVDDVLQDTWLNVDNWDLFAAIDDMRCGADSMDAGTSGTFYLDEIKITDVDSLMGSYALPVIGGLCWGEAAPTAGERPISWQVWDDGAAGAPTIIGDQHMGELQLSGNDEGRSPVYDFGNNNTRTYTLTRNRYGAGQGDATLQIRGGNALFAQDDGEPPNWNDYTVPLQAAARYIQVREVK